MNKQIQIAIFASGSGTNAENIIRHFHAHAVIKIKAVYSNKKSAGVHQRAEMQGVPSFSFSREEFSNPSFLDRLKEVDYIILAGFLWLIPGYLIHAFPGRILNIHPALLPKFGGKGMYGAHVHEAVVEAGETESGITIHLVNEEYDEGEILFQTACEVSKTDTPVDVARKIHALEYKHFPQVIEQYIKADRG